MADKWPVQEWEGCFGYSWDGFLVSDAIRHPAKFARKQAERIVDFCLEEGFWDKKTRILDPFAGVGTGGVVCASRGVPWVGMELEERWFNLARQNFELHRLTWEGFGDPFPEILHGDSSQHLLAGLASEGLLSSPPYEDTHARSGSGEGNGAHGEFNRRGRVRASSEHVYGDSPGQLGGSLSSPPYEATQLDQTGDPSRRAERMRRQGKSEAEIRHALSNAMRNGYGTSSGQAANRKTFWEQARTILLTCHGVLEYGSVCAWVVKSYTRNRKIVDFPGQWASLVSDTGFQVFLEVHAMLDDVLEQPSLYGGVEKDITSHKSFFRRVMEQKGSPEIKYEVILFARKK